MLIYTIITLTFSIPFVWLGIRINRGDLNLIHDYHQKKVKEEEKAAYGKAFSKGMFGMPPILGMRFLGIYISSKETGSLSP